MSLKKIMLAVLLVAVLALSISSIISAAGMVKNGHWLYDGNGNHRGCATDGQECAWGTGATEPN